MKNSFYNKILVCCDGSKYSEKAISKACVVAKTFDSELSLIYVVDKSPGLDIFDRKEYLKILRKYGKKVLSKAELITTKNKVKSKSYLKEGKVADEITKFAKKGNYDLIVVGSKGLGAITKFFLGSVSNKLANQSQCSVLIIK